MKNTGVTIILTAIAMLFAIIACEKETEQTDNDNTVIEDNLPNVSNYPIVSTNQTKHYNNKQQISHLRQVIIFMGKMPCIREIRQTTWIMEMEPLPIW